MTRELNIARSMSELSLSIISAPLSATFVSLGLLSLYCESRVAYSSWVSSFSSFKNWLFFQFFHFPWLSMSYAVYSDWNMCLKFTKRSQLLLKTVVTVKGRTFPEEVSVEYSKDQTVCSKEHLINSSNTQFTLLGGIGNKRNDQGERKLKKSQKATVTQLKTLSRYSNFCPRQRSQNTELVSSKWTAC